MSTTIQNLPEIRIGRDWLLQVTEQTSLGHPRNMESYTVELCIKYHVTDPDTNALFKSNTLYAPNLPFGHYGFHIPHTQTANYSPSGSPASYEIVYVDTEGFIGTRFAVQVPLTPSITIIVP